MIIADTGAMVVLVDRKDPQHRLLRKTYEAHADDWLVPWAILPEVDYLLAEHVGKTAQEAFLEDLADGAYTVEWGRDDDLDEAQRLATKYASLAFGLVDAVVMAIAVRRRARAIATLDLRHFGGVRLPGAPQLWPRDL